MPSGKPSSGTPSLPDRLAGNALIGRRIVRGSLSNSGSRLIGLLSWFVLAPIILSRLGPTQYGLWVVVGSVVGYGWLLDLGIGATLVKYLAEYRARGDNAEARVLIATSVRVYAVLGLLALVLGGALAWLLPRVLNLADEERSTAAWLVLAMAASVGVGLPCSTGASVLRALHRFDLVAAVGAVGTVATAVGSVAVLLLGGDVVAMVAINIPVAVGAQLASAWLVARIAPELRLGWRGATWRQTRSITTYATPLSIIDLADLLQRKTDELVIGTALPVSFVTPFALARGLAEVGRTLTSQFVQVLLPIASELEAQRDLDRLRALYIGSTRLALVVFVPIGISLAMYARQILTAWVGESQAQAAPLLLILLLASMAVSSQSPARWILQGIARHRYLAVVALGSGLANLALSLALVRPFGLTGVAFGTLIPMAAESLGFVLPYAMRVTGVSAGVWLRSIALPALIPVLPQGACLYLLDQAFAPRDVFTLAAVIGTGWLAYIAGYALVGATPVERALWRRFIAHGVPS